MGMQWFSKIDLKKGSYQVEIAEEDRSKTAFATNQGKFEFNRVPFGLLNAPKFFHNVITETLRGIKNVMVFVDDIILFSKIKDEHLKLI
jgi:hypothetical protein